MKTSLLALFLAATILTVAGPAYPVDFEVLHSFAGGPNDGRHPCFGNVTLASGKVYGMTPSGGDPDAGTVFSMDTDGTNFTLLHEFADLSADGTQPLGGLVLDSSKLYGLATGGPFQGHDTIFSLDTDGSNYTILHRFSDDPDDGHRPEGSPTLYSGKLYGMTEVGGEGVFGTVFSLDTDGANYTRLHEFAGGNDDGGFALGNVTVHSGKIYGMTYAGGDSNLGTVFSMDTDGSDFTLLHEFAGGTDDGANPESSLTLYSGKLYGMTPGGGNSGLGTIFSMDTDGTNFTLLHEFAGGSGDGQAPLRGNLTLHGAKFYGMTPAGGDSDAGVIFSMDTDGSNFTLVHEFAGGTDDGWLPYGSLTSASDKLYGMTYEGGEFNNGTLFVISELPGDVNGDGYVGGIDLSTIITNWGMNPATREQGDLSGDGFVTGHDYSEVVTHWGTGVPPEPPSAIPEPATLALFLLASLAILAHKRK